MSDTQVCLACKRAGFLREVDHGAAPAPEARGYEHLRRDVTDDRDDLSKERNGIKRSNKTGYNCMSQKEEKTTK